jgi:hypothetical protein
MPKHSTQYHSIDEKCWYSWVIIRIVFNYHTSQRLHISILTTSFHLSISFPSTTCFNSTICPQYSELLTDSHLVTLHWNIFLSFLFVLWHIIVLFFSLCRSTHIFFFFRFFSLFWIINYLFASCFIPFFSVCRATFMFVGTVFTGTLLTFLHILLVGCVCFLSVRFRLFAVLLFLFFYDSFYLVKVSAISFWTISWENKWIQLGNSRQSFECDERIPSHRTTWFFEKPHRMGWEWFWLILKTVMSEIWRKWYLLPSPGGQ